MGAPFHTRVIWKAHSHTTSPGQESTFVRPPATGRIQCTSSVETTDFLRTYMPSARRKAFFINLFVAVRTKRLAVVGPRHDGSGFDSKEILLQTLKKEEATDAQPVAFNLRKVNKESQPPTQKNK